MKIFYRLMLLFMVVAGGTPAWVQAQDGVWTEQYVATVEGKDDKVSFRAIAAPDTLHCMAVGFTGTLHDVILRTTDGGIRWQTVKDDPAKIYEGYIGMAYPFPSLCMVVGKAGRILRTSDGGDTWQKIPCDATFDSTGVQGALTAISMRDSLTGVIVGGGNVILRTMDGGMSWHRLAIPPVPPPAGRFDGYSFTDVECFSAQSFVVLMGRPSFPRLACRTDDAGEHWSIQQIDSIARFAFTDSLHACGVGSASTSSSANSIREDVIARTTDGGRSWNTVLHGFVPPKFGLEDVAFADANNGIATGGSGKVTRTTDGGISWQTGPDLDSVFHVFNMVGIAYPFPGIAWAVTVQGQILSFRGSKVGGVDEPAAMMGVSVEPNPAGNRAVVGFTLPRAGHVRLELYDVRGELVRTLIDERREMGEQRGVIDAATLPAGVYWYRLQMGDMTHGGSVVVVR